MINLIKLGEFVKQKIWVQYLISIFPIILTSIYIVVYILGLFSMFSYLEINNRYIREEKYHTIYEISKIKENKDSSTITVKTQYFDKYDVTVGDIIYSCVNTSDRADYRCFCYNENTFIHYTAIDPIITMQDDKIYVNKKYSNGDEIIGNSNKNGVIYEVYLEEDAYKIVYYIDNKRKEYTIKELPNLYISKTDKNKNIKNISIREYCEVEFPELNYTLCSALPSKEGYYSSVANMLLKNIEEDYYVDYMKETKFMTVFASVSALMLLEIFMRNKDYSILSNKLVFNITLILLFCYLYYTL